MQDLKDAGFDTELTGFTADDVEALRDADSLVPGSKDSNEKDNYSRKVEAPIYEPQMDEPPPVTDLFDTKKTAQLLSGIAAAERAGELPDGVATFLRLAAHRHTVFEYEKVAEFYAHASQTVKHLMEDSALVIIDFDRAIENGFIQLSAEVLQQITADEEAAKNDEVAGDE
jgi:hypothetical protein